MELVWLRQDLVALDLPHWIGMHWIPRFEYIAWHDIQLHLLRCDYSAVESNTLSIEFYWIQYQARSVPLKGSLHSHLPLSNHANEMTKHFVGPNPALSRVK